jgi:hypothetical protein
MHDPIEEVSPGAVFGLDDPPVGVGASLRAAAVDQRRRF